MKQSITFLSLFLLILFQCKAQDDNFEYDSAGNPLWVRNEFIICFDPSIISQEAINNLDLQSGTLEDFLSPAALQAIEAAGYFDSNLQSVHLRRIFSKLTTDVTTSLARDEITAVPVPPLWSTFIMEWNNLFDMNYKQAKDSLVHFPIVSYTEFNKVMKYLAYPNDALYCGNVQQGMGWFPGNTATYDIGCDEAWNHTTGSNSIKIGINDTGINQLHEDLSEDGSNTTAKSRVKGGYNFVSKLPLNAAASNDQNEHGTALAGIVGAIRNNNRGVAGMAGGNFNTTDPLLKDKFGIQLYDMKVSVDVNNVALYSNTLDAVEQGALNAPGHGYGLHVMNYSYGTDIPAFHASDWCHTMKRVHQIAAVNQTVQIAANGNTRYSYEKLFPAQFNDNMMLRVGAFDFNGALWPNSTTTNLAYGGIIAPGTPDLYTTLHKSNTSQYLQLGPGSSYAAAHVSGAAGLMLSYYKDYKWKLNELDPEDVYHLLKWYAGLTPPPPPPQVDRFKVLNLSNSGVFGNIKHPDHKIRHLDIVAPHSSFVNGVKYAGTYSSFLVTAQGQVWGESATGATVGIYNPLLSNKGIDYSAFYTAEKWEGAIDVDLSSVITGPNVTIVDKWMRTFSCSLVPNWALDNAPYDYGFCELRNEMPGLPRLAPNHVYAVAKFWHLVNYPNNAQMNVWYPFNPLINKDRKEWYALSVHTYEPNANGINEDTKLTSADIIAYPNPAAGVLTIQLKDYAAQKISVRICDLTGKTVKACQSELQAGKAELNVADLENGIYFVTISAGSSIATIKVNIIK